MKYLFILLFISNCYCQDNFNQFDQNGLKHGFWKGLFEASKRVRYEGKFDHGVEIGVFNFYEDSDGKILLSTRTFSNNGTEAITVFFDKNKIIISQGKTVNKLHEGEWKYFHEGTTALMITENYIKGKLIGSRKVFYLNQQIAEESTYKNGKKEGVYKKYTEQERPCPFLVASIFVSRRLALYMIRKLFFFSCVLSFSLSEEKECGGVNMIFILFVGLFF